MEQEEYAKEEIDWSYIEFVDNQDILDLIEKKPGGIIALLDEACMFPRSTHSTFAEKLYQTFKDHKRFSKPKLSKTDFTICHYAGDVTYQTDLFLDKNKDYVVAEHQALLGSSKCTFVSSLFPPLPQDSSKASKFSSIGARFKQQLQTLLETLSHTEPHYLRCVKPNNLLKPAIFENQNILQQLRCGGVMEAIRISCAGFPTRKPFDEFIERFKVLSPVVTKLSDEVEASKTLCEKANLKGYQIGKTKVFLRAGQMAEIDARRTEVLARAAIKIQAKFLAYSLHNKFVLLRSSAIPIQALCRGEVARLRYERRRREVACLMIQKNARMHSERKAYTSLSVSAIKIQNGIRGMATRNVCNYRRQTKAAIGIQSRFRQYLACIHYLRMRKAAMAIQSFYRGEWARKELRRLKKAAKDTSAIQTAKIKLEREFKEATMRLQQEEQTRADMEEAKNKEIANLQSAIKEMEVQLADMEEAKHKESGKLQSDLKEMEVQLADMEEAKNKENAKLREMEVQLADMEEAKNKEIAKLQSALKEMEIQLADMEEAKNKENAKLQSALKELEIQLANMEEAKDKEIAKLQSALKEIEVQLADMEEAKNKETTELQSALKEMEVQFQETKELLEVANKEMEQLRVIDNEKIEKLTTDNEKLKDMVNSLEQDLSETQKKYEETSKQSEERLQQGMDAESKIIELKMEMQSLQERISDMEAEAEIMRQQEGQSGTPSKRFDSNLTQSTIGRERDLVDTLMKAAIQDLGFCQGKPVSTYVIYKSLLHWKSFEAQITTVFDRIIQMMGSAIEKKEDIKHMAYWLSVTSTMLFLVQKTLSPSPLKLQQPTSLFGRMTQGFRSASIISIVHHVEAKYPAVLFKKLLAAYVEKIYSFIRNNLKKDLSSLLSSCITAPLTSEGNPYPTFYWEDMIECLNGLLGTLKEYYVPSVITQNMFAQVFSYIDVQLFNSILLHKECCTFTYGEYVKAGLAKLELWCSQATTEYADSASDELTHVRQAVEFLVIQQKSKLSYDELTTNLCPVLSVQQHYRVCTLYSGDNDDAHTIPPEVISKFKVLIPEDSGGDDSDSYVLDDNSSIPFPIDEIGKLNKKEFVDIKPTHELLDGPEFQYLRE